MALTYSALGQADPTASQLSSASPPTDLSLKLVDVTIGSTSDYSSGLTLSASSCGLTAILDCLQGTVRQSGGTQRAIEVKWDSGTSKLRIYQGDNLTGASDGPLVEISGSNLAAADVVRVALLGI